MKTEAENLVEQFRVLLQGVLECVEDPAAALAQEKLDTVERSLKEFQRLGIPVTADFEKVRLDLTGDARRRDDALETLAYVRSSFADLRERIDRALPRPTSHPTQSRRPATRRRSRREGGREFSFTKPRGFVLEGRHYDADTWIGLLLELSRVLSEQHGGGFQRVLEMRGTKHPNFSREPGDLVAPKPIGGTGIYVDAHRSATHVVRIALKMVELFGYGPDQFTILEPNASTG